MLDIIAAPQGPIEIGTDTPATITLLPGGSGANQAAWLAALDNEVYFVGRVGSDSADWHAAALREHGVTPVLARDDTVRTGMLVNVIAPDGERSFLTDRGANARLSRADLPDWLLDRVGLIHLSGYALADAHPRAAVLDFLASAQSRGIPITVDPASVSLLRAIGPAAFLDWTRGAQICFPNAAEAATLVHAHAHADDDVLALLATHYETVVVKRGAAGAAASLERGARRAVAPAPAASAIDTTGAGDAFVAGFLTTYVRGETIDACLAAGVAAGSSAVQAFGGRPPLAVSR